MYPAFVTVRTSSTRLPRKCFLSFRGKTVLEHIVDRCILFSLDPIVCTSTNEDDDQIEELCRVKSINFFRGSERNKLKRWSDCCSHFGLKEFHTVDADDPFFCGNEVKRSMDLLRAKNLDIVTPSEASMNGAASVGYSIRASALHQIISSLPIEHDTEMVSPYIERSTTLRVEQLLAACRNKIFARLTLDYIEDYAMLLALVTGVGHDAKCSEIDNFLNQNKYLIETNLFRNADWEKKQKESILNKSI